MITDPVVSLTRSKLTGRFGSKLSKKEQVSNWARNKLTDSQIKYAATDAWISRELYVLFLNIGLISKQ